MVSHLGELHVIRFCIQWSSIALLYYDYTLTFGMEVQYIWREKFRLSTVLYLCCRYSLVANVVYLLTIAHKITGDCQVGSTISSALSVVGRAAVIIVWAARTFAVCGKNRWICLFLGTIGLMIFILDTVSVVKNSCNRDRKTPFVGRLLTIMMCVFEISTVGLTTYRSIQALNVYGPWWKQERSFTCLIFEQGVLYFCVVTGLTITSLGLNIAIPGGFLQRLLDAYTFPLSGLMTARFLLHLRKWQAKRAAFRSSFVLMQGEGDMGMWRHSPRPWDSNQSRPEDNRQALRPASQVEAHTPLVPVSLLDQFGEDPVRLAQACGPEETVLSRDDIVEESRV